MKKRLSFLGALIFCLVMAIPAFAIGPSYYSGGFSQWQETLNDGVVTGTTLTQDQYGGQETTLGYIDSSGNNQALAVVDTESEGYMENTVGDNNSGAYTYTDNGSYYGVSVDNTGISAGVESDSSAGAASAGNANAYGYSWTVSVIHTP
ncbi:MAG TPA: hypothetical protein ENL06_00435 [Candidatus Portnoybacteria bacterium]|nr:hypothetical protein [Candidatus Portnoybacteria bacterium]